MPLAEKAADEVERYVRTVTRTRNPAGVYAWGLALYAVPFVGIVWFIITTLMFRRFTVPDPYENPTAAVPP